MSPLLRRGGRKARRQRVARDRRDVEYSANSRALTVGNRVQILVDGDQTFPAMLDAINEAKRFIHLETYILTDDAIGETFARNLINKAREGVTIRVLFDAVGSITLSRGFVGDLRDAGIHVLEYRPLVPWRYWGRLSHRDHRKILVVDGLVGFTGGLNIGLDYAPPDVGGSGWRDTHCRIEGPVVAELEKLFSTTWNRTGRRQYEPYEVAAAVHSEAAEGERAHAIGSGLRLGRTAIRRHYLQAFKMARESILIANAYFIPDPGVRRALMRAAKRGVRVAVMTSEHSDLKSVQIAGEAVFARLLKGGVEIYLWPKTHLHAKTAVVDGIWSAIGSYNLDYISLFNNQEVIVEVIGSDLGERMNEMHEADYAKCRQLSIEEWKKRPVWRKLLEWFLYKFKRWF